MTLDPSLVVSLAMGILTALVAVAGVAVSHRRNGIEATHYTDEAATDLRRDLLTHIEVLRQEAETLRTQVAETQSALIRERGERQSDHTQALAALHTAEATQRDLTLKHLSLQAETADLKTRIQRFGAYLYAIEQAGRRLHPGPWAEILAEAARHAQPISVDPPDPPALLKGDPL